MVLDRSPEATYQLFFEVDASQDARAWSNALHFPHVRMAATGQCEIYENPKDFVARTFWTARKATGWVRTQGIEPQRIHESTAQVHLAGGWRRLNAEGQSILENRVVYVLRKVDRNWRIQGRLACGSMDAWTDGTGEEVKNLVETFLSALQKDKLKECIEFVSETFICLSPSQVNQHSAEDSSLRYLLDLWHLNGAVSEVTSIHDGKLGSNVGAVIRRTDGSVLRSVFLVAKSETRPRIRAISFF